MPKYEYKCPLCGEVVEVNKTMNDSSQEICNCCELQPVMVKIPSVNNLLGVG